MYRLFNERAHTVFNEASWEEKVILSSMYNSFLDPDSYKRYCTFGILQISPKKIVSLKDVEYVLSKLGWDRNSFTVSQNDNSNIIFINFFNFKH